MSDNYPLRFSEAMAYLLCIVVSTAMIWLLLLSRFEPCELCTEKIGEYGFLLAFVLIIVYSIIKLIIILFPVRAEFFESIRVKLSDCGEWFWHEYITKKSYECFVCDKYNFLLGLFFYTMFISLILIFTILLRGLSGRFLFAFIILFCVTFFIWIILKPILYIESCRKSIQYPQSANLSENDEHTAIIFPHYTNLTDEIFVLDCIALLIDGFRKMNKKYRIYHIYKSNNFEDAYYNDKVTELWILGHGNRGLLAFGSIGENEHIEYSKLNKVNPPKKYIVQLHCNNEKLQSLKDINKCDGFVSKYKRAGFHNRCYI